MSTPTDLRTRKRLATRQSISDAATLLFFERGFDQVTVDQIAAAADVGRMTVFNHFPRKEDMFFDREEEGRELLRQALLQREAGVAPVETLRRLAHRLAVRSPYLSFTPKGRAYMEAIAGSEALKARARAIGDELAQAVAAAMCESVGRPPDDADARLAAALLLATWRVAFNQAHQAFRQHGDAGQAKADFLALIEQGTRGLQAAMAGTPYV
ncbi:TetR/AcrR family transcriptional regulator [Duganella sp. HH101]|uniref:TetR/AcrR family transcriptional regulator n=1 Tax=Duganella sp. HH101 TaxID=1781066 RepID=UPI0008738CBF|nr:TetR/AcrR family transcriptional regulator [Duganella sp. HH101]OFA00576.1 DNA-binding transcriptional regulator EnvR [Duganella sp. HH101]